MRVLYGVNGEGMGHATRSEVSIGGLLRERARRARHGLGRRVPLSRRAGSATSNEIFGPTFAMEDGEIRRWASVTAHDDRPAPRAARQRADAGSAAVDEWQPESWSPTSSRSPRRYARSPHARWSRRQHQHDRPLPPRRRDRRRASARTSDRQAPSPGRWSRPPSTTSSPRSSSRRSCAGGTIARAADRAAGDRRARSRRAATTSSSTRAASEELIEVLRASGVPCRVYGMRDGPRGRQIDGAIEFRAALGRRLPRGPA